MKKVIVTVGPSLFCENKLKKTENCSYIYRINGAHETGESANNYICKIKKVLPDADILLDLPGNKVRTSNIEKPIELSINQTFKLATYQSNYKEFHKHLNVGDIVLANDSVLKFIVKDINKKEITFTSKSEGQLISGKGLHVKGIYKHIPFLFEKDRDLINVANKHRICYLGLSFVRNVDDINMVKKLVNDRIEIISKIETKAAVDNINDILQSVDYILVDRGDLSTEVGLEKVPSYQKFIVEKALFYNKRVFLSTQFLKNMEEKPVPTIAEIIDLYNTFKMGVYGIQLSEETAVGKYPMECLEVINNVMREINSELK